jgi:hypothetical protein
MPASMKEHKAVMSTDNSDFIVVSNRRYLFAFWMPLQRAASSARFFSPWA